jgi:hypothetical protein
VAPRRNGTPPATPLDLHSSPRLETAAAVRRLAAATSRLASTIRATEELAESRAELLRTATSSVGMDGTNGSRRPAVVSLTDAALRSGRNPEVLRRWCQDGRIPALRIGRTWAITNETLATLMEHRARSRPRLERKAART